MCRSCIIINIGSIRFCIDNISLCSQSIKYGFCEVPWTSVRTVKSDFHSLERIKSQWDQITDITISSWYIVYRTSNLRCMCKRNLFIIFPKYFQLAIQILFNLINDIFLHFFTLIINQLDSVIIIRIMACRDHNTTIKPIGSCHISYRRCRRNMKQVSIRSRSYQTANQCIFKHIAWTSCIFSDHNTSWCIITVTTLYFSVIPSKKSSDLICMICC